MAPIRLPQTLPERRFNTALVRTRVIVERSFGVLKKR